ncbi:flagellar protein FlgJ [Onishia taeanensis]|uniref:Peptidoglycan hydrolase FlgJ n=1 Tax=Onishia taeanensis TaxID=284577 RepID=A0A1G7RE48_9GAMM|nr:flagellar assembly peptidoglycan hydrolase FlgJ [Halomonas taeanensis]SDG09012.1 flagellar protein FlgJ [Halomonas taeanensis]
MTIQDMSGQFALDMQGFQRLKHTARVDEDAGRQAAAKQFEALFLQKMMTSMRDAIPKSDLFNSKQTEMFTSLLDQQWSQHLAGQGFGLAEMLEKQLGGGRHTVDTRSNSLISGIPRGEPMQQLTRSGAGQPSVNVQSIEGSATPQNFLDAVDAQLASNSTDAVAGAAPSNEREAARQASRLEHVENFRALLEEPAQRASRTTGVPAELILSQAALETGWGRYSITTQDGSNSHNLFGIKAGSNWQGETTDIRTHEVIDGKRVAITDSFRVYDSYEAAFTDYARLIGDNPRYAGVLTAPDAGQAARALQAGGYATDPRYADKLIAVMGTLGPLTPESQQSLAAGSTGER